MNTIYDPMSELKNSVNELQSLVLYLAEDANICLARSEEEPLQFWLRSLVRTMFAMVEGVTFRMKQIALQSFQLGCAEFSLPELAILREESYELKENGEPRAQTKFLKFNSNLRFTFKTYAKALHCNYVLDLNDEGWSSLNKAVKVRNRLTHPKAINDLEITADNYIHIQRGLLWFMKCNGELMNCSANDFVQYFNSLSENKQKPNTS
jgi:hypothetical protein